MGPAERHAAALAAIDCEEAEVRARRQRTAVKAFAGLIGSGDLTVYHRQLESLSGRRRILERHAPHEGRCTACLEWCDCHPKALPMDCPHGNKPHPCPDWLDAAAGLPDVEGSPA